MVIPETRCNAVDLQKATVWRRNGYEQRNKQGTGAVNEQIIGHKRTGFQTRSRVRS
jgi:hypothetical protein